MVNEVDTKMANELIPLTGLGWDGGATLGATFLATIALFTLVWGIHVKIRDAGVVDFFWAGAFVLTIGLAVGLTGSATATTLWLAALVVLWAARLTVHMVWRHRHMGGEDARYRAMRERGGPAFWWKSLFTIYWVQAVVQFVVAAPLLAAALANAETVDLRLVAAGTLLFAVGFLVEAVADRQLWSFKSRPENAGRLMTGGLFAWSRHPNYFGEVLLWWGLGLIALATSGAWWALLGPFVLTGLLIKVSGVELLDAHLARTKPGFGEWAARTPGFVPRPPRAGRRPARQSADGR